MLDDFLGSKRSFDWYVQFLPVLVLSFVFALIATWLCKAIAIRFNIVDKPDNLVKTHKKPVAYLGGVGVLAGFIVGALCGIYIIRGQNVLSDVMRWLFGILAGAAIACFVGIVDDILDISPGKKMLGQIIAAIPIMLAEIQPDLSEIVKSFGWQTMSDTTEIVIGIPIIIFFVLGATNSLNLRLSGKHMREPQASFEDRGRRNGPGIAERSVLIDRMNIAVAIPAGRSGEGGRNTAGPCAG